MPKCKTPENIEEKVVVLLLLLLLLRRVYAL